MVRKRLEEVLNSQKDNFCGMPFGMPFFFILLYYFLSLLAYFGVGNERNRFKTCPYP